MTTFLDVATTLDVYEWPAGGDFRWRWALETTTDPTATSGPAEDVSDVTAVRMWLQLRVAKGVTPRAPYAFTNSGGQVSLDTSGSPAYLAVTLADADASGASPPIPAGDFDVAIYFDRPGTVRDHVAQFVLRRYQGPRPGP